MIALGAHRISLICTPAGARRDEFVVVALDIARGGVCRRVWSLASVAAIV